MAGNDTDALPVREASSSAFGGSAAKYRHVSGTVGCTMRYSVFLPPGVTVGSSSKVPALLYLAGLTCTEDTFFWKAGALRTAAACGIALIAPDTSPRGLGVPGEDDEWDLGTGAGFYLDATEPKWAAYRMRSYIIQELLPLVLRTQPINPSAISIFGHSMGGHGAITLGLAFPNLFQSISAFAPVSNPVDCPWGLKVFTNYLGTKNKDAWKQYDSCAAIKAYSGPARTILVDQGTSDKFLDENLKTSRLEDAAKENSNVNVQLRFQEGYDHSYYFISTFVDDHIHFHAKILKGETSTA